VPQQLGHEGWSEAKFSADGIHHADPARCPWWRFGAEFTGRLGAKSCKINIPAIPGGKLIQRGIEGGEPVTDKLQWANMGDR